MSSRVNMDDLDEDDEEHAYLAGTPFTGTAIETDRRGAVVSLTTYVEGVQEGPHRLWWPDGVLKLDCVLHAGRPAGTSWRFHSSGELQEQREYDERGFPRSLRRWNDQGDLIDDQSWEGIY